MFNRIVLSGTAAMKVAHESAQIDSKDLGFVENGGLLLGRKLPGNLFVVAHATDGGPNSHRYPASFSPDTEYLNRCIEEAERSGLLFLGEWHLHPGILSMPSHGDEETIRRTIFDNAGKLSSFVAIIVNVDRSGNPRLFAYEFERDSGPTPMELAIMDDNEVNLLMPWYETAIGKKKLVLDSRAMSARHREFKLQKKDDRLFWIGEYRGHQVFLIYPIDFPKSPISIGIKPAVDGFPDEPVTLHAALAAEAAFMRIDNALLGAISERPITSSSNVPNEQWYETDSGKKEVIEIDSFLRNKFSSVKTQKLHDGQLAFKCDGNRKSRTDLLVLFPIQYPETKPEIRAFERGKEIDVQLYPDEDWKKYKSVELLVNHTLTSLKAQGR